MKPFYYLTISFLFFIQFISWTQPELRLIQPKELSKNFDFTYSSNPQNSSPWGGDLNQPGVVLTSDLVLMQDNSIADSLGCSSSGNDLSGKTAVVYRGECYFDEKVLNAQNRGAEALIIINNIKAPLVEMLPFNAANQVTIPCVMISMADGEYLINCMKQSEVTIMLGNFQDYYQNNLALSKELTLSPPFGGKPLSLLNQAPTHFDIGSYLINRGTNQVYGQLRATVVKESDTIYKSESNVISLNSGDSIWVPLPPFNYLVNEKNTFQLSYQAELLNEIDEDTINDNLTFEFTVTDDLFSLAKLDSLNQPISNSYITSDDDAILAVTQCILFQDPNASQLAIDGLYFSVEESNGYDIELDEMLLSAYKWDNKFNQHLTNYSDNFSQLQELETSLFYFDSNSQDLINYAKFDHQILLKDNQKYLFCITPTSKINLLLGYNKDVSYSFNNIYYEECNTPIRINEQGNITPKWYNGFSGYQSSSIGLKFINADELGLKTNIENNNQFIIYPNPTTDVIQIKTLSNSEISSVRMYDVYGKTLMDSIEYEGSIDVSSYKSGMYFIQLVDINGNSATVSFLKN